jgi:hypothetical protein
MSKRQKFWALALAGVFSLFVVVHKQTIHGLAMYLLPWKEDAFEGKNLLEFQLHLSNQGRSLTPVDASSFLAHTGEKLAPNQRVFVFEKGKPFHVFFLLNAINIGYVVVETRGKAEWIVDILHSQSVNGL